MCNLAFEFTKILLKITRIEASMFNSSIWWCRRNISALRNHDRGLNVRSNLAELLELSNPSITWHVARDGCGGENNADADYQEFCGVSLKN